MDAKSKYLEMEALFRQNANEEESVSMAKYMRDKFPFYGIPSAKRKELYKAFLRDEKKTKQVDWDFLDLCYENEHREFHYLVYDYLLALANYLTYADIPNITRYIKAHQWWDTIDFYDRLFGSIGLKDDRVDSLMLEWSKDDDFWLRRIAIDHQLGRKEKTNTALLEQIILNNLGSTEFFVNKAIGWALRDYSKVDPDWVRDFLGKYRDKMDKVSITEAVKYI